MENLECFWQTSPIRKNNGSSRGPAPRSEASPANPSTPSSWPKRSERWAATLGTSSSTSKRQNHTLQRQRAEAVAAVEAAKKPRAKRNARWRRTRPASTTWPAVGRGRTGTQGHCEARRRNHRRSARPSEARRRGPSGSWKAWKTACTAPSGMPADSRSRSGERVKSVNSS